jgi:NADH-quinone oxidoreductase subunit E
MSILTASLRQQISTLVSRYPASRSAVMPALHLAQTHSEGNYLCQQTMREVAECLQLPPIFVLEVATFYGLFHTKPVGRYHLQLCTNVSCMLRGADELQAHLEKQLALNAGESSSDGLFTLSTVECLGACEQAPMMQLNNEYLGYLDKEKLDGLIAKAKEDEVNTE